MYLGTIILHPYEVSQPKKRKERHNPGVAGYSQAANLEGIPSFSVSIMRPAIPTSSQPSLPKNTCHGTDIAHIIELMFLDAINQRDPLPHPALHSRSNVLTTKIPNTESVGDIMLMKSPMTYRDNTRSSTMFSRLH